MHLNFYMNMLICITGDSYQSLSYLYRIGRSTFGVLIPETCRAIYEVLKDTYMKVRRILI